MKFNKNELQFIATVHVLQINKDKYGSTEVRINKPELTYEKEMLSHLRFPKTQALVNELVEGYQVDRTLAWAIVISACALLVQGLSDIDSPWKKGGRIPLSVLVYLIAKSGDRKSAVFNAVFGVIRRFEQKQKERYESDLIEYELEYADYLQSLKLLDRKILELKKSGDCIEEAKVEKGVLMLEKPQKPKRFLMLYEDVTTEAYFEALENGFPSAAICSDEGGNVINSAILKDFSKFNSAWDGSTRRKHIKTGIGYEAINYRSTGFIALQQAILFSLLEKKGRNLQDSGYFARAFFCEPPSMQGKRKVHLNQKETVALDAFSERAEILLEKNLSITDDGYSRTVERLSRDSLVMFEEFSQQVEDLTAEGFALEGASEHASKLPEVVLRIAGVLHVFEGFTGQISTETLEDVICLCKVSTCDYLHRFVQPPQVVEDARKTLEWLAVSHEHSGNQYEFKQKLATSGPYSVRGARHSKAIDYLCSRKYARLWRERFYRDQFGNGMNRWGKVRIYPYSEEPPIPDLPNMELVPITP